MSYDRLCKNTFCNKPFSTSNRLQQCCSRPCAAVFRPPIPLATRFWAKVRLCVHGEWCPFCCWEWTAGHHSAGYGVFSIKEGTQWKSHLAHRVAWELVNGRPVPDGLDILHHCDNPPCCSLWHTYPGTPHQNTLDAQRRRRLAVGEARSSLKTADVLLIQTWYREGATLLELAQQFHVDQTTISHILSGRNWQHVPAALSSEERQELVVAHKQRGNRRRSTTILTEDNVREIRVLGQKGTKHALLAQQFGVGSSTIGHILQGKRWKDVY